MTTLRIKHLYSSLLLLIAFLMIPSCARNPVTGDNELMLVSESQEIAMGAQADPSIVANFGLYNDQTLQNFIDSKGQQMAAISHRPNLEWHFRVLDSPVLNAFALPGGYVYFTRGILAYFNNEAEFAGVLGHEIGHITARHSAAQISKQQLFTGLLIGGMIVSEEFRQFSDLAAQGLGLLFLKFGRDDESQSDKLGVEYSTKIGYDAHEMANFFQVLNRMQEESGQAIPTFLSTHPNPANRFENVHEHARLAQQGINSSNLDVNRESYLNMIDGLVFGEDPRQGYVENNVFYHPEMRFQFPIPSKWQVINTPQMVQIAHVQGNQAKAIILLTLAQESNLDAAAQATVERDQLQVVESSRTNVNGLQAIAMISEQVPKNPDGTPANNQALRILTYLIQYNNQIYKFHGISLRSNFNTYYNTFNNTMTRFNRLTDSSKINVTPDRIQIVSVRSTATLQNALTSLGVSSSELESAAVLNNMQLSDQVQRGMKLKVVEKGKK